MFSLGINKQKIFCKSNLSPIKKNIIKLSSGTIFGQCISMILIPILTRIFGPAAFGDLAVIQSTVIIINSFSDLGLTRVLMISNDEEDMAKIYKITTFSIATISILFSLLYLLMYPFLKLVDVSGNIFFIALLMIVTIFTTQQIQVGNTWLNRKGAYNVLLWNPIISSSIYAVVSIVLGLSGYMTYGLPSAWGIAQIATLLHIKLHIPKLKTRLSFDGFMEIMAEYRHFVVYQMPTNVIIAIRYQLPVFLIKGLFDSTILGYYSMVMRILQIPISLVAGSIGTVFFKTIADMARAGQEIGQFVYNNIDKVMKIAIIPMFIIVSVGDIILVFILGSRWATAGIFLRILGLQNLFLFLVTTCS
ncbi:MAG: oligosaccharide flippase family protein, partial [Desulfitobacteriaceae bacterium]